MAQSIKLGSNTFIDETGVSITPRSYTLKDINPTIFQNTYTTGAYGTVNLGVSMNDWTPISIVGFGNTNHPSGFRIFFLATDSGGLWAQVFDASSGSRIDNESLIMRVTLIRKASQT